MGGEEHTFLLPDAFPVGATLGHVTSFIARPMPHDKFELFLREVISATLGSCTLTPHGIRHWQPGLGKRTMMTPSERLDVGIWAGAEVGEDPNIARRMAMPLLYASERMAASAMGKAILVRSFRRAVLNWMRVQAGNTNKKLSVGSSEHMWRNVTDTDMFVPYWPIKQHAEQETADFVRAKLTSLGSKLVGIVDQGYQDDKPAKQPDVDDESEVSSGGDSTGTSSDSSVSTQVGDEFVVVHGQRADSKLHVGVSDYDEPESHGCTRCGRRLAMPSTGEGPGYALATLRSWSPRCFRKLPSDVAALFD